MTTQQLLEMLRTWPEFETMSLDWLEQYPPDTPIMDALKDAPHGGDYIGGQWLEYLLWYVSDHLSPLQRQAFKDRIHKAEYKRATTMALEKRKREKAEGRGERNLDAARRRILNDIRPLMGEEKEKARSQVIAHVFAEYWKENHAATYKFLQDTNGLFEVVLEVLYNEHKEFQRALDFVSDNLLKHSSKEGGDR